MQKILIAAILALIGTHFLLQNQEVIQSLESSQTDSNIRALYEQWKMKYGKNTNSQFEDEYRFTIFTQSYHKVEEHKLKKSTYTLGLTKFADLTNEEFASVYLMEPQIGAVKPTTPSNGSTDDFIVGSVDWRKKGAVNPVQDQGQCGSCYTFATAAAIEATSEIQSPYGLQKFSEQQLVSCSQDYGNEGCNGGTGDASMSFVIENGIQLEANYPYVSGNGEVPPCQDEQGVFYISSFYNVVGNSDCQEIQKTVANQPVYGRVTTDNWSLYTGGVFQNCSDNPDNIGHAITIIGYDTTSDNADERYWLIKNSWGTGWGEQGYIQLKYGNTCAICTEVFAPQW